MNREEIRQEAEERVNICTPYHTGSFIQGYIAGAESRENKIADIKANCDIAIEGRDVKIKELEQQIERAVDIIRDLGSTVREGVTCHYLVDNGGLHRATLFIKEIKEND